MERHIDIGAGLMIPVDFAKLAIHDAVIAHVQDIGARNILMDSHASVKRDDYESDADWRAAKLAVASKKLATMYDGSARARVVGAQRASSVDPVMAESLREARVFVGKKARGWEKAEGSAINWLVAIADKIGHELPEQPTSDDWKELVQKAIAFRANKPESIETARKIVELRKPEIDVEI